MKKVLLLGLLALCITSCSSKLSKEEATAIISSQSSTYCTSKKILKRIQTRPNDSNNARALIQERMKLFYDLEEQGLITIKEKHSGFMDNPDIKYYFELTEKAKSLYHGKIVLTTTEFVEIIGMAQTEDMANIKYRVKSVKTPFYPLHKEYARTVTCYETTWEKDIILVKYDTGWKIKK